MANLLNFEEFINYVLDNQNMITLNSDYHVDILMAWDMYKAFKPDLVYLLDFMRSIEETFILTLNSVKYRDGEPGYVSKSDSYPLWLKILQENEKKKNM